LPAREDSCKGRFLLEIEVTGRIVGKPRERKEGMSQWGGPLLPLLLFISPEGGGRKAIEKIRFRRDAEGKSRGEERDLANAGTFYSSGKGYILWNPHQPGGKKEN